MHVAESLGVGFDAAPSERFFEEVAEGVVADAAGGSHIALPQLGEVYGDVDGVAASAELDASGRVDEVSGRPYAG